MENAKLFLFDLDTTLVTKWEPNLLPGRLTELRRLQRPVAIVTNQGGVHAHYAWAARGRPERAQEYLSLDDVVERLTSVTGQLPMVERAYVALHVGHDDYPMPEDADDVIQTLETGVVFHASWDPGWRKPSVGMLRQACADFNVAPTEAVMVGDRDDDVEAAAALGMTFVQVSAAEWETGFLSQFYTP